MKFNFPIIIIDEDFRSENSSGFSSHSGLRFIKASAQGAASFLDGGFCLAVGVPAVLTSPLVSTLLGVPFENSVEASSLLSPAPLALGALLKPKFSLAYLFSCSILAGVLEIRDRYKMSRL